MFDDIIELLLHKKAALREELEREFALRSEKIDRMLTECGYVEPVEVVETSEEEIVEGVTNETVNIY